MSYSFTVKKATKTEALEAVAIELQRVVESQPSHAIDKDHAMAVATTFVGLLPDDDTKDVWVSVNGSIGWRGTWGVDQVITSAGVGVSAQLWNRDTP